MYSGHATWPNNRAGAQLKPTESKPAKQQGRHGAQAMQASPPEPTRSQATKPRCLAKVLDGPPSSGSSTSCGVSGLSAAACGPSPPSSAPTLPRSLLLLALPRLGPGHCCCWPPTGSSPRSPAQTRTEGELPSPRTGPDPGPETVGQWPCGAIGGD